MPVRRSLNASPKASTSSSSGTDLSGMRLLGVTVFVLITFGLFVYMQHDVLNNAEEVMEMNKPPTVQVGIERVVRGSNGAAADSLSQNQDSFLARERSGIRSNGAENSAAVGGFLASSSSSSNSVSSKSTGGFIPRKFRSASAAAMAGDETAKSALRAKISNIAPSSPQLRPSSPVGVGKYVEVDLVAEEGRDVGNLDRVSSEECAAACDKEPRCHSFSYSALLLDCWLKDRDFCSGGSVGHFERAPAKDGDYHTFYRDGCDGPDSIEAASLGSGKPSVPGAASSSARAAAKKLRGSLRASSQGLAATPQGRSIGLGSALPSSGGGEDGFKTHAPPANARQQAVQDAMKWAWDGYVKYAWGKDELHPKARRGEDWFGLGLTLVDALDTLYIMDLQQEFKAARDWIDTRLNLATPKDVNLFETTIRVLGGFLSTYALSGDEVFLEKARELGDRLMPAFKSASGVPFSDVNLKSGTAHKPTWGSDSSTAEVTTLQLEFKYLSHVTGDRKYADAVEKVSEHVAGLSKKDGLVPYFINANTGRFGRTTYTLGARGDSYYEYLLKQWLQTGRTERKFLDRYLEAMAGVRKHLIKQTSGPLHLTYVAEMSPSGQSLPKMDHLVCFLPGALALGSVMGAGDALTQSEHMELAKKVLDCCEHMYSETPTFLAGEITHFEQSGHEVYIKPQDSHNLLRPETVESLFLLWRLTGDSHYQEVGWKIFQAFEKYCRISSGGYTSLDTVLKDPPTQRDKMETFFLGETLKYFYLLFGDDPSLVSLNHFVFNTEAHPLPVFTKL